MAMVYFGEQSFPVPDSVTDVKTVKHLCGQMVAGLSEAEGRINENGDFIFEKKSADKGLN